MAANVVEATNRTILTANEDERIRVDLNSKVIAWPQNFTAMAGKNPSTTPNAIEISAIDFVVGIKLPRQGPSGPAFGNQQGEAVDLA
jgi:hypothetical protein